MDGFVTSAAKGAKNEFTRITFERRFSLGSGVVQGPWSSRLIWHD